MSKSERKNHRRVSIIKKNAKQKWFSNTASNSQFGQLREYLIKWGMYIPPDTLVSLLSIYLRLYLTYVTISHIISEETFKNIPCNVICSG